VTALRISPDVAAWAGLAADLVNTRPRETDPPEKLRGAGDLRTLLAACPEAPPPWGDDDLADMRAVRESLAGAFAATSFATLADALNPLLDAGWQLVSGPDGWTLAPAGGETLARWFGARAAHGLAQLALAYGLDRLHLCRADDCLRAVVDVSRNGTRRYCARACANRMSARRYRAAR
jgi:CGNR zinc finger